MYGGNQETNEQLVNDWFHFTINDEELKLWYQSDLSFDTLYELDDITFFSQTIKNMSYEFFSRGLYRESMIELYTKLLFTKLLEIVKYRTKDLNPLYDSFLNLRTTIQNHPMRNWQIDDISKSMSLSRSRVQHLYKYFFDSSIAADVINYRMERARYFLYHSTHSISKIAEISGYDNVSCFIRQFKKTFGTTPLKYRNQIHRATQYYVKKPEYECKHKQ